MGMRSREYSDGLRFISGREFKAAMDWTASLWNVDHPNVMIAKYLSKESETLSPSEQSVSQSSFQWRDYSCFWPPRLLNAYRDDKLIAFFGAGLSIPSGLLSWSDLLSTYFGLSPAFLEDGDLQNDPLTLAELASHQIGSEQLQSVLRSSLRDVTNPSVSHVAAAALRLPFYITTNYDCLFEKAFEQINSGIIKLIVIANSSDLAAAERENPSLSSRPGVSYLIKIHGCVQRHNEHLILTRSDYRRHYRFNKEFFDRISDMLIQYHVLFLGFSHGDPEVGRLVEDAIWRGEGLRSRIDQEGTLQPNLYSLQYGMSHHAPEVFAAKGIVALRPSLPAALPDVRTAAVSRSLSDLIWATQNYDGQNDLDSVLNEAQTKLSGVLGEALSKLEGWQSVALQCTEPGATQFEWMTQAREEQAGLCGQGLYLVGANGNLINLDVPPGLDGSKRSLHRSFGSRPYFQQARTFRRPFVSDSVESTYNQNSTFMLCVPLVDESVVFRGLLFGACQIGAWEEPINLAHEAWGAGNSFLLIDSNGICLMPPKNEFDTRSSAPAGETAASNIGYEQQELLSLSRRDRLIARIMENVVPLDRDDDVLALAPDFAAYSVIAEINETRWKLAISSSIQLAKS
jgi:hypothetical protein